MKLIAQILFSVLLVAGISSSLSAQSKKSKTEKELTSEVKKSDDTVEKEEEKYTWKYSVVRLYGKPGALTIKYDKDLEPSDDSEMYARQKKLAYSMEREDKPIQTETDFLNMMTELGMELVSVVSETNEKGSGKAFYFRTKVPLPRSQR